jgi:hypothetical protein
MTEIPGCGTGGWTLVMKTNGDLVRQKNVLVCRCRKYLSDLVSSLQKISYVFTVVFKVFMH